MNPLYDYYIKKRERKIWDVDMFSIAFKVAVAIMIILPLAGCSSTTSVNGVPLPYNLSAMGNSTGIVGLTQMVNDQLMDGFFGLGILVTTFIIIFGSVIVSTGHAGKAFAGASFLVFAVSIPLFASGLIEGYIMYSVLALVALSVAFLKQVD